MTIKLLFVQSLFCSLFLAPVQAFSSAPLSVADVVKGSSGAVVQIEVSDSLGHATALGSGFLISSDGKIVTNYHVIKGAHSAIVKLANGAFFPVEGLLAVDVDKDLAILKVAGKNLPFLSMGNSVDLHVGDHVVAIGSPLGLEGTVSDGIVSAIREEQDNKWIQTTAPVSHGNSGGPLLDLNGTVAGVITWGVNLQLGQNLNFAASSDEVKALLLRSHPPSPLGSTPDEKTSSAGVTGDHPKMLNGVVWTSISSGRDFMVRRDGDHLYTEWVNLPTQLQGSAAFTRSDLTLSTDGKWRGEAHGNLPCTYTDVVWTGRTITKWCTTHGNIEIDKLSETRIEGVSTSWEKFDCHKCEPHGTKQTPFTWIPK